MSTLTNRYQLAELIYDDDIVVAHRAYDQVLHRSVVVEMLSPQATDEHAKVLSDKARRAALVRLPHVAALYDQNTEDGRPFLVWEAVLGPTLNEAAPLAADQAANAVIAAAMTLQAALSQHQQPPIIDASTVCIGSLDRVQILDLGVRCPMPDEKQAIDLLVRLLLSAFGQPENVPASMRSIVERGQKGAYSSIDQFVADLRKTQQRFDGPTSILSAAYAAPQSAASLRSRPAMPTPAAIQQPVKPKRIGRGSILVWLAFIMGVSVLTLLIFSTFWVERFNNITSDRLNLSIFASEPATTMTPIAEQAQAPTGTDVPLSEIPVDELYIVNTSTGDPVHVRSGPGLGFEPVSAVPFGEVVTVLGDPQPADGYNWVPIRFGSVEGWCISEALIRH